MMPAVFFPLFFYELKYQVIQLESIYTFVHVLLKDAFILSFKVHLSWRTSKVCKGIALVYKKCRFTMTKEYKLNVSQDPGLGFFIALRRQLHVGGNQTDSAPLNFTFIF